MALAVGLLQSPVSETVRRLQQRRYGSVRDAERLETGRRSDRTKEDAIMSDCNNSARRISNWTLATGTVAGARHVYPAKPVNMERRSASETHS